MRVNVQRNGGFLGMMAEQDRIITEGTTMLPTAHSLEGQPVPDVSFKTRSDNQWKEVASAGIFQGRTVVVFSLPGAFTPTCSSAHLPRYNELADAFTANGVDEIVCLAVNDAFVMEAWKQNEPAGNVTLLPDGNGEFTAAMGLLVDKSSLGLGKRSWRYSMLVKDGVIEKMFIEPEKEGDPLEVSDAETMLKYINPKAAIPEPVVVFAKPGCARFPAAAIGRKSSSEASSSVARTPWPRISMSVKRREPTFRTVMGVI